MFLGLITGLTEQDDERDGDVYVLRCLTLLQLRAERV